MADKIHASDKRCSWCDRADCRREALEGGHVQKTMLSFGDLMPGCEIDCPACRALKDCNAHRVDWRARALAAEKERDEARGKVLEAAAAAILRLTRTSYLGIYGGGRWMIEQEDALSAVRALAAPATKGGA